MRLPATTTVTRGDVERDAVQAARSALDALEAIRAARGDKKSSLAAELRPRGVVKLGYSWQAVDVRSWAGEEQLAGALRTNTLGFTTPLLFRLLQHAFSVGLSRAACRRSRRARAHDRRGFLGTNELKTSKKLVSKQHLSMGRHHSRQGRKNSPNYSKSAPH